MELHMSHHQIHLNVLTPLPPPSKIKNKGKKQTTQFNLIPPKSC